MGVVRATITGDLETIIEEAFDDIGGALSEGVARSSDKVKSLLRAQVKSAGLGTKLEKAWRSAEYPRNLRQKKVLDPAALVYSKATRIHAAMDSSNTVRARNAKWLVIPAPAAIKAKLDRSRRLSKSSQPLKWSEVAKAINDLKGLRFVKTGRSSAVLVADEATPGGRLRKQNAKTPRRRRGGKLKGVVMFFLVRFTRGRKRLDIDRVHRQAPDILFEETIAELVKT